MLAVNPIPVVKCDPVHLGCWLVLGKGASQNWVAVKSKLSRYGWRVGHPTTDEDNRVRTILEGADPEVVRTKLGEDPEFQFVLVVEAVCATPVEGAEPVDFT